MSSIILGALRRGSQHAISRTLSTSAAAAAAAAAASVVDQMVAYARREGGAAGVDVARAGLAMLPDPAQGADAARLLLTLSELAAARADWEEAASAATRATAAAASDVGGGGDPARAGALALSGALLSTRALLAAGRDAEAAAAAALGAGGGSGRQLMPPGHPLPAALRLLTRLACGSGSSDASGSGTDPSPDELVAGARSEPAAGSGGGADALLRAAAAKIAGDALLLASMREGGTEGSSSGSSSSGSGALAAYETAATIARKVALLDLESSSSSSSSSSTTNSSSSSNGDDDVGPLSRRFAAELAADASLGLAQVHARARAWDAAEDALGSGVAAAEASAGERGALLAPLLTALGHVYARSARVMYSEGVLREGGKLAGLPDPARLAVAPPSRALHPSLHAALAWRYAQLLAAMPNRGGEADAWEAAARELWQRSCAVPDAAPIEAALGDRAALTGRGAHGSGCLLALLPRRVVFG